MIWILIFAFACLSWVDVVLTVYALDVLGGVELNPVLDGMSSWSIALLKVNLVGLLCYVMAKNKMVKVAMYACVVTLGAVVWNAFQIGGY